MLRWIITLGIGALLLAGVWSEGVRFYAWTLREQAEREYYAGDLESALASYSKLCELLPRDPRSHTDLADSIAQAIDGKPGRAMAPEEIERLAHVAARSYLNAISASPPNAWAYAGFGQLAGTLSAARVRQDGLDLSDLSADPMEGLRPLDRLYEAALVKAVQIEPRNYYYRDFLGHFYLRHGFQERALAHVRTAARLQPVLDRHFYLSRLATVSPAILGAVEQGIREALESGGAEASVEKIHRFLADIYLRMGRLEEARANYEAVAELTAHPYLVDIQIGRILAAEGDEAGALDAFQRSTERNPDYASSWLHLGMTLSRTGRHEEALEALQRARGLDPAGYRPSWALAMALDESGRLDEAAALLENLIKIHSDRQQAYSRLIRIYERQERLSQAVRVARLLAERYPGEHIFEEQVRQLERAMGEDF
jgi:tetratricopeptide (TPR) repeat protein